MIHLPQSSVQVSDLEDAHDLYSADKGDVPPAVAVAKDEQTEVEHNEEEEVILRNEADGQPSEAKVIDNRPTRTIYKGRKYNWQAKVNLHIHIIEHKFLDTLEIVAFNTSILTEAAHVYVSTSLIQSKIKIEYSQHLIEEVHKEYSKLNMKPPAKGDIEALLRRNAISSYICDRLTVTLIPTFSVDVKDIMESYRIPVGKGTELRRNTLDATRSAADRSHIESAAPFAPHHSVWSGKRSTAINPIPTNAEQIRTPSTGSGCGSGGVVASSNGAVHQQQMATVSLLQRKPEALEETEIKRFGKSTTLIGTVIGEGVNAEEDLLGKFISQHNSPAMVNTQNVMSRLSNLNIGKARKAQARVRNQKLLRGFQKFRNDNDLLQESLSFLHVSDLMRMRCVCKRWSLVLSNALQSATNVVISSRDYYNRELIAAAAAAVLRDKDNVGQPDGEVSRQASPVPEEEPVGESDHPHTTNIDEHGSLVTAKRAKAKKRKHRGMGGKAWSRSSHTTTDDADEGGGSASVWRKVFVRPSTLFTVLEISSRNIHTLKLHYVVINLKFIGHLSTLAGRLKVLSLGIIKLDDTKVDEEALQRAAEAEQARKEAVAAAALQAEREARLAVRRGYSRPFGSRTPSPVPTPNPRSPLPLTDRSPSRSPTPPPPNLNGQLTPSRRGIIGRPHASGLVSGRASSAVTPEPPDGAGGIPPDLTPPPPLLPAELPVSALRYMNGSDVKSILFTCGSDLLHLELSITIGPIPQEAFKYAPKLITLTARDTILSEEICNSRSDFDGQVQPEEFVTSLTSISMPDLLSLMSDATHEAFMITDKRGHICVANDAWERLTGYSSEEVSGIRIGFLRGPLSDEAEFDSILEAIKCQISPEVATTFLHRPDGMAYLCQVLFVPNVAKFRGLPLTYESLSQDFLAQLALDQVDADNNNDYNQKRFGQKKGMKDLIMGLKEHSYHLFRFGCLCQPFNPDKKFMSAEDDDGGGDGGGDAYPAT